MKKLRSRLRRITIKEACQNPAIGFVGAPETIAVIGDWRDWLLYERRCSPHTLDAYSRDLAAFLYFVAERIDTALPSRISALSLIQICGHICCANPIALAQARARECWAR
jgi:site-specific recombinase XerD